MPDEGTARFYEDVVDALRTMLLADSGDTGTLPTATGEATGLPPLPTPYRPGGTWVSFVPLGTAPPSPLDGAPSVVPSWDGFHFVGAVTLVDRVLIAFRWRETGDELFVWMADLRHHLDRRHAAVWSATIIEMNLLERLGTGWHLHVPLRRIGGFTFLE